VTAIKVLLVDDSLIARRLISSALNEVGDIEVVGTAASGTAALGFLSSNTPDAVILDYEMPGMNGVETLRKIREIHAALPVIIFSGISEYGVRVTIEALAAGASDFVAKPTAEGPKLERIVSEELAPRLYALCRRSYRQSLQMPIAGDRGIKAATRVHEKVQVIVIASSTGGPSALATLLARLPSDLSVPIAIVQHMPPIFTRSLAERLDAGSPLSVKEAEDGDILYPGQVGIAPGNYHMTLQASLGGTRVSLNQGPPENSCRPSADVLFRSAAEVYGPAVLAAVLTGMGCDGLEGARAIVRARGTVLAQDELSAVVASMPRAIARAGLADAVLPPEELGVELAKRLGRVPLVEPRGVRL